MKISEKLIRLVYPPRCPVCDDIKVGNSMVCRSCADFLPFVEGKLCKKCGKPLGDSTEELCFDCGREEHLFDQGMGIFLYDGVMRKSMHRFKYLGRREYGEFYGFCAWKQGKSTLEKWNPQVVIPIPVHPARARQRGYNQAEVIARELAPYMGIPVETGCIRRREKTVPQKELSPEERKTNLLQAFDRGKKALEWERILLVDDIYTTGSTMDAAARILKEAGANEIYALSICIGKGFMVQ